MNYDLKEKICDSNSACKLGITKNIKMVINYKEGRYNPNKQYNLNVTFDFEKFHKIEYKNIGDTTNFPTEILNNDTLIIEIEDKYLERINVIEGSKLLNKNFDYQIEGNKLIVKYIKENIKVFTYKNYLDNTYPLEGSKYVTDDLQLEYLGDGVYCLNGTTTKSDTYIRLSYDLKISNNSALELVDGNTIIKSGNNYYFEVVEIDGNYENINNE